MPRSQTPPAPPESDVPAARQSMPGNGNGTGPTDAGGGDHAVPGVAGPSSVNGAGVTERSEPRSLSVAPWQPLAMLAGSLTVETTRPTQFLDLTDECNGFVARSEVQHGTLIVSTQHTTCGLVVNEHESGLWEDVEKALETLLPRDAYWAHDDLDRRTENLEPEMRENGFSHARSLMMAHPSLSLPVVDGELHFGCWQRLLLLELDGARTRTVTLQLWGARRQAPPAPAAGPPHVAVQPNSRPTANHIWQCLAEPLGDEPLTGDLARVEDRLRTEFDTRVPYFTEVTRHHLHAGGKRLRPLLTLASAYTGGPGEQRQPADDRVVTAAASVELLHLGTLYHDDVIDGANTRRGQPSVNSRWSNSVAIMGGDFLLASSSAAAASLGCDEARIISTALSETCRGQALEMSRAYDVDRSAGDYEEAIAGKTARLIETACRLGALEAGLDGRGVEALAAFGHDLGMAFQIVDDILDLVGTEEVLGKPAGHDLVEGVYTLPTIYALEESPQLRALLLRERAAVDVGAVRSIAVEHGAIERAWARAEHYTRQAQAFLASAPPALDVTALEALSGLGNALLERSC